MREITGGRRFVHWPHEAVEAFHEQQVIMREVAEELREAVAPRRNFAPNDPDGLKALADRLDPPPVVENS